MKSPEKISGCISVERCDPEAGFIFRLLPVDWRGASSQQAFQLQHRYF
ncbi:MAG: hypothetical protein V4614_14605 [Pseudomonadota bacterium]